MKRHSIAAVGLVAVLVALGGCASFKTGWEGGFEIRPEPPLREHDPLLIEEEHETLDEAYARIARLVPGFGGIFFDEFGILNVYLTDLSNTQEAFARLEPLLLDYFGQEAGVIPSANLWRAVQGRYNYLQLMRWYNKLVEMIFQDLRVVKADIDERNNRLILGIKDLKDTHHLLQRIRNLDIPPDVVAFEDADFPVLTSTLNGEVRPVVGGVQVVGSGGCTLMLPVRHSAYGLGFITNAHCAKPEATVPNPPLKLYQPNRSDSNLIGNESLDPPVIIGTVPVPNDPRWRPKGTDCLAARPGWPAEKCRWSDSAFFTSTPGISMLRGHIAKVSQGGDLTIIGYWPVVAIVRNPPLGMPVNKVGQTSGWTSGRVTGTCQRTWTNWWDERGPDGRPIANVVLLCQNEANYWVESGDSGAPVFSLRRNNTAILVGISWGHDQNIREISYFSPVGGIMKDLNMVGGFCAGNLC